MFYKKDQQSNPSPPSFAFSEMRTLAEKKGLDIVQNVLTNGYTITLPNGSRYHARTYADARSYLKDY